MMDKMMIRSIVVMAAMMMGCVSEGFDVEHRQASTIADASITGSPIRVSIPMQMPFNSNVFPAMHLSTTGGPGSGLGLIVQIPMIPVGSTIVELDARVRDSIIGPTKAYLSFADQIDNGFQEPAMSPGLSSTGVGGATFQTISLPGINRTVQQFHTYYAGVFLSTGTQPCAVSAIDMTYIPAP